MCGIVAYLGHRKASEVILNGLKRLEYRGYDSAGMALISDGVIKVHKKKGSVQALETELSQQKLLGNIGIGHTRWATHGQPNDLNAHPHTSSDGKIAVVHNGIIENYDALRKELLQKGHTFQSETDTEVLVHLFEEIQNEVGGSLEDVVRIALHRVIGAYGIVVISSDEPNTIIGVRKGSPLVIGVGVDEYFFASDATPIIEYTKDVIYLNDGEVAVIRDNKLSIKDLEEVSITPYIQTLDLELEAIEKGEHDFFMLKEIHEQPKSIQDCLRGRLKVDLGTLKLGGLEKYGEKLYNADRIIMLACGTSYYAGLTAEYFFEEVCRIPVEVEYASEFRYRNPVIREGDAIIAISQSGETADTLVALELAKERGATVFGVCNVVGSSIARASHEGVYTHAGPEIGVASTKAFTAQLAVLNMIALQIAQHRKTITQEKFLDLIKALSDIPQKIEVALKSEKAIEYIASEYADATNALYLGRGCNYPVAMEGALKLKEISYIHAEGYPAAEMKHGPIALIDENMPVIFIATKDQAYDKIVSNIQEVKSRQGQVIAIVTEGDSLVKNMVDFVIEMPSTDEAFSPMINVIPLQLLAYYIGTMKGFNVDRPRNLAKSVTVE